MNPEAVLKIELIKKSLRCFMFGLISLIPLFGFPFVILAFVTSWGVRRQSRLSVNPARRYLRLGTSLALLGILSSLVLGGMLIALLLSVTGETD